MTGFPSGFSHYIGEFNENGAREGKGRMIYGDNEEGILEYDGDWRNGLRHGFGKATYKNGSYLGNWVQDIYHGYGEECTVEENNTFLYKGEFDCGFWHGIGRVDWTGGFYKGNFHYGSFDTTRSIVNGKLKTLSGIDPFSDEPYSYGVEGGFELSGYFSDNVCYQGVLQPIDSFGNDLGGKRRISDREAVNIIEDEDLDYYALSIMA
jgi:hypothetical protein